MATNLKDRPKPKGGQAPPSAGTGGDGRALSPGDNRRAVLEAEEAQLLSYVAKLRALQIPIDEAKATLAEAKAQYDEVVRLAGVAGFKKYELKELLDDLGAKRRDLTEQEERRARFRAYVGLPCGNTGEQLDALPETARDGIFWEADGYACGVRGTDPKPPSECGVHGQAWMKGYHNGQARNAWALDATAKGRDPGPPQPEEEREKTPAELKAEEKRVKEKLDALPKSGQVIDEEIVDNDPLGIGQNDDDFEATPEELNGQVARQVVQAQREVDGDAPGSDDEVVG